MSHMKYRAVFQDPGDITPERPVQILGNNFTEIDQWADKMLAQAQGPDSFVTIYETTEMVFKFKRKPRPEAAT